MKSYEQKYKEALGWMKSLYGGLHGKTKEEAEKYFPELAESEDEKIRKAIITFFESEDDNTTYALVPKKDILAWLEKQGDKSVNIDIESMVSSYKQRLKSQGGVENTPLVNMCLTAFRQGVENVLDELSLKKLEKQGKPKWSDEDEKRLQSCIVELQGKGLMGGVDTIDTKWLKSLKQRIHASSAKTCKNDTILDLFQKMPPFITVDGVDYYFVMKKTSFYTAYYKAIGEEGSGNAIFWATAFSPIDLLNEMLEKLKNEGLLELTL